MWFFLNFIIGSEEFLELSKQSFTGFWGPVHNFIIFHDLLTNWCIFNTFSTLIMQFIFLKIYFNLFLENLTKALYKCLLENIKRCYKFSYLSWGNPTTISRFCLLKPGFKSVWLLTHLFEESKNKLGLSCAKLSSSWG